MKSFRRVCLCGVNLEKNFFFIFLVLCFFFVSSIKALAILQKFDPEEDGSGLEDNYEDCLDSFVGFEDTFLRGVKEENFITYDTGTFDECLKHCCLEKMFNCTSFSYLASLSVCYVMNLTKYDERVQLQRFSGWMHYHKKYLIEETTMFPEATSMFTDDMNENSTDMDIWDKDSFYSLSNGTIDPMLSSIKKNKSPDSKNSNKNSESSSSEKDASMISKNSSNLPKSSESDDLESLGNGILKIHNYLTENKQKQNLSTDTSIFSNNNNNDNKNQESFDELQLSDVTTPQNFLTEGKTASTYSNKKEENINPERLKLATNVKFGCSGMCKNGGKCKYPETRISNQTSYSDTNLCNCKLGFTGKFCEVAGKSTEEAGLPPHIVAVAVIGSIIFLLLATVLIVCVVYRHKTGKYRVKFSRDKWRKKKSKQNQPKRSESFISDMRQSPNHEEESESHETLDSNSTEAAA